MPKRQFKQKIPPPPGPEASWEEPAAYFERYSAEDLEAAGYQLALTEADQKEAKQIQHMAKQAILKRQKRHQLNLTLHADEIEKFQALAKKRHIPPSTLARAWFLERLDSELTNS